MMSFIDFFHEHDLKNKAKSNIKFYEVSASLFLKDMGIHLGDGPFSSDLEIVKLHPTKGKNWVVYINENYFDSYGCGPPKRLSKFIIKRYGHCLTSEYKTQGLTDKRDSYCASFCLYINYLTKVEEMVFKSCVFNINYQMKQ